MIPISVCIITKNEENRIRKCLAPLAPYPFEIVVVDTGSTDQTVEIVSEYTDHIYHFDWISDFAAARNFSIAKASHDWILVLDSDEYLTELDLEQLYRLAEENPEGVGRLERSSLDIAGTLLIDRVERFFNRNVYHYERPIHEQVLPIHPGKTAYYDYPIPLKVDHEGYVGSREYMNEKAKRYLAILLESEKDFPDSYTYFQIGQSYYIMEDWENARKYFEKGLDFELAPSSEFVQLMVVHYGYTLLHLGENESTITFLEQLAPYFQDYADYVFLQGYAHFQSKNYIKAVLYFIQALQAPHFHIQGTNSYMACYYIGVIYNLMGDLKMARTFFEKCGDFEKARICLKELDELEQKAQSAT